MPRPFLTAKWHNLFLATYQVPAAMLEKRLPPGLSLDVRGSDGPFVSLVTFQFLGTRCLVSAPEAIRKARSIEVFRKGVVAALTRLFAEVYSTQKFS